MRGFCTRVWGSRILAVRFMRTHLGGKTPIFVIIDGAITIKSFIVEARGNKWTNTPHASTNVSEQWLLLNILEQKKNWCQKSLLQWIEWPWLSLSSSNFSICLFICVQPRVSWLNGGQVRPMVGNFRRLAWHGRATVVPLCTFEIMSFCFSPDYPHEMENTGSLSSWDSSSGLWNIATNLVTHGLRKGKYLVFVYLPVIAGSWIIICVDDTSACGKVLYYKVLYSGVLL